MSKVVTPHFGGLWINVASSGNESSTRFVMHFFGERYLVAVRVEEPSEVIDEMHHYVLGEIWMSRQLLDGTTDAPVVEAKWRWIDDRFLEFDVDGKKTLWQPTSIEQLAQEGFPIVVLQSMRKRFVEAGQFYSEVPVIPDASLFELFEKQQQQGNS